MPGSLLSNRNDKQVRVSLFPRVTLTLQFCLQDRISYSDHVVNKKHLTTDIGSWQNKSGNTVLSADVFHPEQHCNCQERGWIRHHPRCWHPCLVEGHRTSSMSSYISDDTSVPDYSCVQCNTERVFSFAGLTLSDLHKFLLKGVKVC